MNYRHVYMCIIAHAKSEQQNGLRPRCKDDSKRNFKNQYFEFHHILPKSMFPNWSDRNSNIVPLTAREHFFCHQLLTKIYPTRGMFKALWMLSYRFKDVRLTSREYENLRKQVSISTSEDNKRKWRDSSFREKRQQTIKTTHNEIWKADYIKRRRQTYENMSEAFKEQTRLKKQKTWEEKMRNGFVRKGKGWRDRMTEAEKLAYREKQRAAIERAKLSGELDLRIQKARETWQKIPKEAKAEIERKRQETRKEKQSQGIAYITSKGCSWWNNGVKNTTSKTCPGEGWVKGMLRKR